MEEGLSGCARMWLLVGEASMCATSRRSSRSSPSTAPGRIAFCTDDRDPEDIVDRGHVSRMVRDAVAAGIEPADMLMASLHPAQWRAPAARCDRARLRRRPPGAPGLERFVPDVVLKRGRPLEDVPRREVPDWVKQTVKVKAVTPTDFAIPWEGGAARTIELVADQV